MKNTFSHGDSCQRVAGHKEMDFFQSYMNMQQEQLRKKYQIMNGYARKGEVLFVGSSLMEHFPLNELAQSMGIQAIVYNRGIGGYKTADLWNAREECIFGLEPEKIFINIGSNDIGDHEYCQERLLAEYRALLEEVKKRLPGTKVYVMAYYPVNPMDDFGLPEEQRENLFRTRTNEAIDKANEAVHAMAEEMGYCFIDVNDGLKNEEGNLQKELSTEGLHMYPNAYWKILSNLKRFIEE